MSRLIRVFTTALLVSVAAPARAQVSPTGSHHFTAAGGTSSGSSGGATGIGIDLPPSRKGLPLPLSIVHTGSPRVGAAGVGWDVPISSVRVSTSITRRKPAIVGAGAPRRVFMTLEGNTMMMVPAPSPKTWQPLAAPASFDLVEGNGSYVAHDASGVAYVFTAADDVDETLDDPGLYLLTEIRDPTGTDRVVVDYAVDHCNAGAPDLRVTGLRYSPRGQNYLFAVEIDYRGFGVGPCGGARLDTLRVADAVYARSRIVAAVRVLGRDNLDPSSPLVTLREYALDYPEAADVPRLARVDVYGEGGIAGDAPVLPVARYSYGSAVSGEAIVFENNDWSVSRPNLGAKALSALGRSTSKTTTISVPDWTSGGTVSAFELEMIRASQVVRDMTGDGIADLVVRDSGTWWMWPGTADRTSVKMDQSMVWLGSNFELDIQTVRTSHQAAHQLGFRGEELATTKSVWTQLVDWNGDGRPDIVNALGGVDVNHWLVRLNTPGTSGTQTVSWVTRQVSIAAVRKTLLARGFKLDTLQDKTNGRVPISRSRTSSNVITGVACKGWRRDGFAPEEVTCQTSDAEIEASFFMPSHHFETLTEWKLADLNGDGYPDIVSNYHPLRRSSSTSNCVHVNESGAEKEASLSPPYAVESGDLEYGESWCVNRLQLAPWSAIDDAENTRVVAFHNQSGALFSTTTFDERTTVVKRTDTGCGVEAWRHGPASAEPLADPDLGIDENERVGDTWFRCGFLDLNSDGLPSHVVDLDLVRFENDRHTECAPGGSGVFTERQTAGLLDVTGDGLADRVYQTVDGGVWRVEPGLGAGFGAVLTIGPDFELSRSSGTCDSQASSTDAALDLDGDGRPERVRVRDGVLRAASIIGADGQVGAHSAGRLVSEANGYGAASVIEYTSAKRQISGRQGLAVPEIVVASTRVDVADGRSIDPTYFAYGDAELRYDPFTHRWTSAGYDRRVVMSGVASEKSGLEFVTGVVAIADAVVADSYAGIEGYVTAGKVSESYRLEGAFLPDPWLYLLINPLTHSATAGGATVDYEVEGLAPGSDSVPECYDVDPTTNSWPITPGSLCVPVVPVARRTTAWHGRNPPPSLASVETATTILALDALGRPTRAFHEGDTRRSDDDLCTEVTYATPTSGSHVRDALATRRITNCGRRGDVVYGGARFEYDGLSAGTVAAGLRTGGVIELHEADTGAPLGEIQVGETTYDPVFAQQIHVEHTRSLGVSAPVTSSTDIELDPWGYTTTRSLESADDASTLVTELAASLVPSRSSSITGPNGERSIQRYDAFGRPTTTALDLGGTELTLRQVDYHDDPGGRWTETWISTDGLIARPETLRAHIDALGRTRYVEQRLGADYNHASVLTGVVKRDGVGRVVFAAKPIECSPPDIESCLQETHYGRSVEFLPGGRLYRTTLGWGHLDGQRWTVDADEIYPTTFEVEYVGGEMITRTQGPVANTSGHVAEGATDVVVETAIGRTLEVRREQGAVLERTRYDHDPLGNVSVVTRFGDPAAMARPVAWTSTHDSLGRRLTLSEPGAAVRHDSYDEVGALYESRWSDGAWTRIDRAERDGHGRLVRRTLSKVSPQETQVEADNHYVWDVHSGSEHQPVSGLLGRLSHMQADGVMETFFAYDAMGRQTDAARVSLADPDGRVFATTESVDVAGRLESIRYKMPGTDQVARYHYDSADRATRVEWDSGGETTTLFNATEIDALGRYRAVTLGNGVTESHAYYGDGRDLLASRTIRTPTTTHRRGYTGYDAAGRVTQRTDRSQQVKRGRWKLNVPVFTNHDYDRLDRLASTDALTDSAFTYDPLGNATSLSGPGQAPTETASNAADPDRISRVLLGSTEYRYSYDGAGSVTAIAPSAFSFNKPTTSFRYDSASRAIGATRSSLTTAAFASIRWDADDSVADIEVSGSGGAAFRERRYGSLMRERYVAELGGNQLERVVPGPLGELALVRSGGEKQQILYQHQEPTGTRMVTDESGAEVQMIDYAPFGAVASDTGDPSGVSYTRRQFNFGTALAEFGVTLLGPRFYHPATGRFLQRDPVMFDGAASSANPYAFSFNDPINHGDPSGMSPISFSGLADAIGGALGAFTGVGFTTYGGTGFGIGFSGTHTIADSKGGGGASTSVFDMGASFFAPGGGSSNATSGGTQVTRQLQRKSTLVLIADNAFDTHVTFYEGPERKKISVKFNLTRTNKASVFKSVSKYMRRFTGTKHMDLRLISSLGDVRRALKGSHYDSVVVLGHSGGPGDLDMSAKPIDGRDIGLAISQMATAPKSVFVLACLASSTDLAQRVSRYLGGVSRGRIQNNSVPVYSSPVVMIPRLHFYWRSRAQRVNWFRLESIAGNRIDKRHLDKRTNGNRRFQLPTNTLPAP